MCLLIHDWAVTSWHSSVQQVADAISRSTNEQRPKNSFQKLLFFCFFSNFRKSNCCCKIANPPMKTVCLQISGFLWMCPRIFAAWKWTSQNVFPVVREEFRTERGNIILKKLFFFCFWPFRTKSGLRLCQLHRPKGCRESHQHVKWTQTSDQNNQGNRHAAQQ